MLHLLACTDCCFFQALSTQSIQGVPPSFHRYLQAPQEWTFKVPHPPYNCVKSKSWLQKSPFLVLINSIGRKNAPYLCFSYTHVQEVYKRTKGEEKQKQRWDTENEGILFLSGFDCVSNSYRFLMLENLYIYFRLHLARIIFISPFQ